MAKRGYFKYWMLFAVLLMVNTAKAQMFSNSYFKDLWFDEAHLCHVPVSKSSLVETNGSSNWDITFVQLSLNIDPATDTLSGSVYFEFTSKTEGLSVVNLDLSGQLQVDSVVGTDGALQVSHSNDLVNIILSEALANEAGSSFSVYYHGKPTNSGLGSYIVSEHNNVPVVSTLSEPWGAMEWWPCKNSLTDKIDSLDVIVRSPEKYRAASNGILILDSVSDSIRTCHWKHRHPIATYLVAFSVTNYEIYTEWATFADSSKVEIFNYVYPEEIETAQKWSVYTDDFISLFSNLLIDYPFKDEKYGHAQFPWSGGMEHQTMTFLSVFSFDLISHELAHQWFGDYITCASWHEIWLNEGFATYFNGLAWQYVDPEWWPHWKEETVARATSSPGGSVYVDDTTSISRIFSSRLSYCKGAYLLHMLRAQIGDDAFFKGLQTYLTDPRVANGFATSSILIEDMEAVADTSLEEFFNDWLYGEGFPEYTINWWLPSSNKAEISITQEPSVENGPLFEMKLPFVVYGNGNADTLWLKNDSLQQSFSVETNFTIDSIAFDPDLWILCTKQITKTSVASICQVLWKLFPNPADDFFMVETSEKAGATIELFSLEGKKVAEQQTDGGTTKIYTNTIKSGIYICKLTQGKNSCFTKFIVRHY